MINEDLESQNKKRTKTCFEDHWCDADRKMKLWSQNTFVTKDFVYSTQHIEGMIIQVLKLLNDL